MAERFYLAGGDYHALADGMDLPKGAVEVPRLPGAGETWDGKAFVTNTRVAADLNLPVGHIASAHAQKAIEATLILSGVDLTHGLIAEEAAALGIDRRELAQRIADHGKDFRAREVARRTMKTGTK